jgi:serine/threonine protein kinase
MSLLGRGATGTVYQLNVFIAVKRARIGEDERADHTNEQKIFRLLENYPPIPYLIRCYYRRPNDTFLELAPNGSVAMLLNRYQEREIHGIQVLKVSQALNSQDICRWMRQLCLAATALERIGLIHGDIRPGNMLLDVNRNLKLSDFDRGMKTGEDVAVLTEPYGRLLDAEDDGGAGTYGTAGARTETFAIGSVYYTLLRGHEPYETESWGRNHFVTLGEKFQKKEFPPLTNSAADAIIRKCWNGKYRLVAELLAEFDDIGQDEPVGEDPDWLETRQMECKTFIRSGLVDTLDSY